MLSSTSSPFKLSNVQVKPTGFKLSAAWPAGGFVRYVLVDLMKQHNPRVYEVQVGLIAHVELAEDSWLSDFGPGHSTRICTMTAVVGAHEADIAVEPRPYSQAVAFGCEQMNPMLDTFTTLFGIEQNIDIHVEHRLRPVDRLLQNLIMPEKARYTYDQKKGFWK